ncbi:MAG: AAA family ATPase [Candidatus Woesearchaeota archaeon]|nr:AAA family ATPase [Candidatus Woesearchaeota archaeon]
MYLHDVQLAQIRSYEQATVSFQEGMTLLAGDIGAGKSTLLLAIEFAFFGISRDVPGSALLRHGATNGSVTLRFSLDKEYTIHRTLKRTKQGVVQDTGWLECEGQRESLTANELKARVFTLLGYPLHFLGKKNLLYRFTMYTPQEAMKQILTGERADVVRRLFGVDTYKTIKENTQALARTLKEKQETATALATRVQTEVAQLSQDVQRLERVQQEQQTLVAAQEKSAASVAAKKEARDTAERTLQRRKDQQQQHALQERTRTMLQEECTRIRTQLHEKEQRIAQSTLAQLKERLQQLPEGEHTVLQQELAVLQQTEGKLLALMDTCTHEITAGTCPTCKQEVTQTHIAAVEQELDAKRAAAVKKHEKTSAAIQGMQAQVQEQLERRELANRVAEQEAAHAAHTTEYEKLQELLTAKETQLKKLPPTEHVDFTKEELAYKEANTAHERAQHEHQQLAQRVAAGAKEQELLEKQQTRLAERTTEHKQLRAQATKHTGERTWLLEQFIPFTEVVERRVLLTIYSAMSTAFSTWCSKLVDDPGLVAAIDQTFTPLVQQHGFDIALAHLSGGERTAVSLAYRLALVHTIHTLLPHLGTAGVLMLDEPTDGFSTEQLARMRTVLGELHMQQIILVSHEQQLEGFVDHIIRVEKHGQSLVQEAL